MFVNNIITDNVLQFYLKTLLLFDKSLTLLTGINVFIFIMKKTLLLALLALLMPLVANAYDFESGGIYYNFNSDGTSVRVTCKTSSDSGYSGSVVIPATITYNSTTYSVTSIGEGAFCNCSALTSVNIPNSVTSIEDYAFEGCSGLTSVTIPNSVTSIGRSAFYNCSGLTSITIPNSVTSIGYWAFYSCSGLTSIDVDKDNTYYDSRDNCNAIIQTSSNTLIAGCKSTVIPNSVTSIGEGAFYNCYGLKSITIPESVTSIGWSAFRGCSGLTSVNIPNSVTSIGELAFYSCTSLTSITIPNSVTSIGEYVFSGCTGLTSVSIPNSVTSIGNYAFYKCSTLTSITIPNSVTSIGYFAFSKCSGLKEVYCMAEQVPSTKTSAFSYTDIASATLYVPASAIDTYKATAPWSGFGTILPIPLLGDANGNGEVEIGDVTSVLTLMATPEATGYNNKAADANGNGEIEIGDVTTILTIMANGE